MRRKFRYIDGKLTEVFKSTKPRAPKFPAIRTDTLDPYWNAHAQTWVESRTKHNQILREKNLIELGNEYDAWKKEVENPDFDDEGNLRWHDESANVPEPVTRENEQWIQKLTKP